MELIVIELKIKNINKWEEKDEEKEGEREKNKMYWELTSEFLSSEKKLIDLK